MDCKTARLLLNFDRARPELDRPEADALAAHLADCPECLSISQSERNIDAHLGRAIRDVSVPDGLRDRLLSRLADDRRLAFRRQWVRGAVAVAAAVLVAVLGWWIFRPVPTQIDLHVESERLNFPPQNAQQVEEAFLKQGVAVRVPAEFNYLLLAHFGQTQLQGRLTPYLEFRSGAAFLRVYILDENRFDLAHLERNPEGPSGRVTVKWWGKSADGKFGYIIEHTGPNIEPFKTRDILPVA